MRGGYYVKFPGRFKVMGKLTLLNKSDHEIVWDSIISGYSPLDPPSKLSVLQ